MTKFRRRRFSIETPPSFSKSIFGPTDILAPRKRQPFDFLSFSPGFSNFHQAEYFSTRRDVTAIDVIGWPSRVEVQRRP
jgi:hypothetical protein